MSLIDKIKEISQGTNQAGNPVAVMFGTVSKVNPLEVIVEQRLALPRDFLIVPETLTEYKLLIGEIEYTIRRGLEVGDQVILARVQGGQDYVILDRAVE
ncbi:DUF2577 domain-containing protein [Paenibacillaceae bacterium]|nr:DUF2577 domain-containing protein [Paenibacillaceae bacterium]